jgi:ABC-type cobalamin/Fe3+-siderophores transport system ATPase subunit
MLTAEQLDVAYGSHPVLKQINLQLPAGEVMGVIGPNGAGKSTLVRALSGVIPPHSGRVLVNGKDLARLSPLERARHIAVVSQISSLPPAFTGWEVVLLGRTPHLNWLGQVTEVDRQMAQQAMQFTETTHLAANRVGELSGGERQRLLLARALAQDAPILLLDEPTTHLDLHHQLNLLEKLRQLASQHRLAVLVTLHDINLVARFTDQVVLLDQGAMIACGAPHDVLQADLLSRTYHTPLQVLDINGSQIVIPCNPTIP